MATGIVCINSKTNPVIPVVGVIRYKRGKYILDSPILTLNQTIALGMIGCCVGFMGAHTSCTRWLSKLRPWSEWITVGGPKRLKTLLTKISATVWAFWSLVGNTSHHLVKWSMTNVWQADVTIVRKTHFFSDKLGFSVEKPTFSGKTHFFWRKTHFLWWTHFFWQIKLVYLKNPLFLLIKWVFPRKSGFFSDKLGFSQIKWVFLR